MNILSSYAEKSKLYLRRIGGREDFFVVAIILLVGFGGFGLGRLSGEEEDEKTIKIEYALDSTVETDSRSSSLTSNEKKEETAYPQIKTSGGTYVASVHGALYHHPWCSGAERIKEENKIWFSTKEEAERAGYAPAKNCKGL